MKERHENIYEKHYLVFYIAFPKNNEMCILRFNEI